MPKNSKYPRKVRERREGDRERQPTALIVCEGKTECVYFNGLIKSLRLTTVTIEPPQSAPISVVNHACQVKMNGSYDTVWCVFDRDEHPTYPEAINKAKDNNLRMIISIPCFEVWIFLHFNYKTPHCNTCLDVEKLLKDKSIKAIIGKYEKPKLPMTELMERIDTAIKNAKKLRKDVTASESFFTNVDELVAHLKSLTTHNRMPQ